MDTRIHTRFPRRIPESIAPADLQDAMDPQIHRPRGQPRERRSRNLLTQSQEKSFDSLYHTEKLRDMASRRR
jgi:hypothetical protein